MATETPAAQATVDEPEKRGFKFPTAFTVLFFVLIVVWVLSFIIKPGSYDYVDCGDGTARPVPGSFHEIDVDKSLSQRLYDLWLAPVNGLYGLQSPQGQVDQPTQATPEQILETCRYLVGQQLEIPPEQVTAVDIEENSAVLGLKEVIGPYESGRLIGAVAVFFFVLAIGAFITVTINTGALDAGIARLVHRFKERSTVLIIALMAVFSLGGTTYGMAEETLGFYALIVPIMVAMGYDRMVGVGVIMVGAGVGTLASTVNPFATGVASESAGIDLGNGIVLRGIMYVVLTLVAILYVLRYAKKVKANPRASLSVPQEGDDLLAAESGGAEPPLMTGGQKAVIWVFMLTFALMIFSVIPWSDFSAALEPITLGWFFPELTALFLVGAVIIGLLGRLGEEGLASSIVAGMGDFMGAAFIIALARGVTVVMNNSGITDTVLNSLEGVVSGLTSGVFAVVMFIVNIPLAFLVPSSSGHAALAMPIMAPLADFAGVSRAIVVTGFQSASGWVNLFTPTSAIVMGGLTLAKVGYDRYVRFVTPLLVILFVLVCAFVFVGSGLSIGGT